MLSVLHQKGGYLTVEDSHQLPYVKHKSARSPLHHLLNSCATGREWANAIATVFYTLLQGFSPASVHISRCCGSQKLFPLYCCARKSSVDHSVPSFKPQRRNSRLHDPRDFRSLHRDYIYRPFLYPVRSCGGSDPGSCHFSRVQTTLPSSMGSPMECVYQSPCNS